MVTFYIYIPVAIFQKRKIKSRMTKTILSSNWINIKKGLGYEIIQC